MRLPPARVSGMIALVGGSGVLHLVAPGAYRRIVPRGLRRRRREVVAVSGVAELVCAALLLSRSTRPLGAWATAALLVAVFPANVRMALDGGYDDLPFPANSATAAWLRLPVQPLLVAWALSLRGAP